MGTRGADVAGYLNALVVRQRETEKRGPLGPRVVRAPVSGARTVAASPTRATPPAGS